MTLKSRGLTAWLWLFKNASQAKAAMKPSKWPGLAWLTASGRALHSTSGNIYCSPSNIYSTAANIYYCAEIYITATNIVFSPRKHSNLPREILSSKREIVTTFYFWNAGVPCFGK